MDRYVIITTRRLISSVRTTMRPFNISNHKRSRPRMPSARAPPWREASSQKISDKLNALIHGDSLWYFVSSTLRTFFAVPLLCQCVLSILRLRHQKLLCSFFYARGKKWTVMIMARGARLLSGRRAAFHPLLAHISAWNAFSPSHSSFPPSIAFLWCKSFADDDTGRIAGCCLLCAPNAGARADYVTWARATKDQRKQHNMKYCYDMLRRAINASR